MHTWKCDCSECRRAEPKILELISEFSDPTKEEVITSIENGGVPAGSREVAE